MTAVLGEFRPITSYWDESVSPTAVGPTPVIPPEPPAEDDSADVYPVTAEELRSVSPFGEGSEAELISPKTAYAGYLIWGGVESTFLRARVRKVFPWGFLMPYSVLSKAVKQGKRAYRNHSKRPYRTSSILPNSLIISIPCQWHLQCGMRQESITAGTREQNILPGRFLMPYSLLSRSLKTQGKKTYPSRSPMPYAIFTR